MEETTRIYAALFDLDGVIIDTETQYTIFWDMIGRQYLEQIDFGSRIKGATLPAIYAAYFAGIPHKQPEITAALNAFESQMKKDYIPGFRKFFASLKARGWKTAIVTSSNQPKMQSVYRDCPKLASLFDCILTQECFERSKPHPDPYLKGAAALHMPIERCAVFEDSINGLKSGRSAGMKVIGLTTTNSADAVQPYADLVIPDFTAARAADIEALF